MEINVEIKPEQINEAVTNAIIESAIGKHLREVIQKQLKMLDTSYNNPIEPVVKEIIHKEISKLIQETYGEMIRQKVKEQLTEEFVTELVAKLWERFICNY